MEQNILLWGGLGLLVLILYTLYVRIIMRRNTALAALSSIEVQLRKRYDLMPNLLKLASKYMAHERGLIEEVTALRTSAKDASHAQSADGAKKLFEMDASLMQKMGSINVAMENYPELKADTTIREAMSGFQDVEDNISAARRFYNSAVTDLNNAIQIFPGNLVAPLARAKEMPFYVDPDSDTIKQTIKADDYL
jgi:LemA protein